MALTEKQKNKKKALHAEMRGFLAMHQIKLQEAADFLGEDYKTFANCIASNRYSNEKMKGFLDRREEMVEALA